RTTFADVQKLQKGLVVSEAIHSLLAYFYTAIKKM
nr:hypothetical protein [Tanacetum cinerariifolium]